MDEGQNWSALGVIAGIVWGVVVALVVGMWLALGFGEESVAQALGFTGCATSAVAAVLSIRRYTCKTQALIRLLYGGEREREVFQMGRDSVRLLHPSDN